MNSINIPRAHSALREKLLGGEPLRLKGASDADRIVMAEWIAEAASRRVRKIDIRHAIIRGVLNLKDVTFEGEVCLIKCTVEERADFRCTTFRRNLLLYGTRFERGVNFDSATIEYDARLNHTEFIAGKAGFANLHVRGVFSARRAVFAESIKVDFSGARIENRPFSAVLYSKGKSISAAHILLVRATSGGRLLNARPTSTRLGRGRSFFSCSA